jgi:hypothetical protein
MRRSLEGLLLLSIGEWLAARGENGDRGAGVYEQGGEARTGLDQVLAVVQHRWGPMWDREGAMLALGERGGAGESHM